MWEVHTKSSWTKFICSSPLRKVRPALSRRGTRWTSAPSRDRAFTRICSITEQHSLLPSSHPILLGSISPSFDRPARYRAEAWGYFVPQLDFVDALGSRTPPVEVTIRAERVLKPSDHSTISIRRETLKIETQTNQFLWSVSSIQRLTVFTWVNHGIRSYTCPKWNYSEGAPLTDCPLRPRRRVRLGVFV